MKNILECEKEIWESKQELKSYATLFKSIDGHEINGENLFGVGIHLEHICQRLEQVEECLNQIMSP